MALKMSYLPPSNEEGDEIANAYFVITQHVVRGNNADATVSVYKSRNAYKNGKTPFETFNPIYRFANGLIPVENGPCIVNYDTSAVNEKTQIYEWIKTLSGFTSAADANE